VYDWQFCAVHHSKLRTENTLSLSSHCRTLIVPTCWTISVLPLWWPKTLQKNECNRCRLYTANKLTIWRGGQRESAVRGVSACPDAGHFWCCKAAPRDQRPRASPAPERDVPESLHIKSVDTCKFGANFTCLLMMPVKLRTELSAQQPEASICRPSMDVPLQELGHTMISSPST